jgi:hypothetical protein
MSEAKIIHWQDGQELYRINHLTKLHPDMLTAAGHVELLENKAKNITNNVLFDRSFVKQRISGLLDDLEIYSYGDAIELLTEIVSERQVRVEEDKEQLLNGFIAKHGIEAVKKLLTL